MTAPSTLAARWASTKPDSFPSIIYYFNAIHLLDENARFVQKDDAVAIKFSDGSTHIMER